MSSHKALFASRIRAARRFAQLSQQSLAERLGLRRAAVTHWENAQGTLPSTANLSKAAIALGVSVEWLATGRGRMHAEAMETPAFAIACVAQSFDEERLLACYRRLSATGQEALLAFLDATAGVAARRKSGS